jgi:ABC-type antimicrobial peptide transport system permease subunit
VVPQINRDIEKNADFEGIAYVPLRQAPLRFVSVAARTLISPTSLVQAVRREVQSVDPDIPLYRIRTMQEHLSQQLWPYRVFGSLFAAFAVISLLLSAIGVYGVIAYSVSERTQEIGLRMALGADAGRVLRLILRQSIKQMVAGLALGVAGAVAVGRIMEKLLIHTSAADPAVNMAGSLLLCMVALFACMIPAWRASRLDPLTALRFRR